MPSLDSEITVPTPTPFPAAAAAAPTGNGNISPTEDIPYPQWGDFVPTTTPVAGQLLTPPPAATSNEPSLQVANGNTFLPTSEQATPIDYYQQTPTINENGNDLFASLPLPPPPSPPASGQYDGANFKNLAVPQSWENLDSAPSSDSLGDADNGEILQVVPGIGKKLRVRRTGGKWRAMI